VVGLCYNRLMERERVPEERGKSRAQGWLTASLPLPPGVNNLYVSVNGRRVLSGEGKRFKAQVGAHLGAMRHCGELPDAIVAALRSGYLSLFIDFYFATPMRRDLDGGLKITQDAICEALGINDNRVVDIHLVKRVDTLHPRIEVQLETINEEDWQFDEEYVYLGAADGDGAAGR
jgi:crossover junction endodeoxyribonuclease RusA